MARILWLADALRAEPGLNVVETDGWRTRGQDELEPVPHGVMFHHTVTPIGIPDSAPLRTVTFGRSDLPGPICNVMVGRSGTAYVVASGKANHAGLGGPWRTVPLNSGNGFTVGVEVVNNGTGEPWTDTVLDACDRVFAAILKKVGKDASWCVGHKEYAPDRKIDPSLDMNAYRARLKTYMEDDMAILTPEEQRKLSNLLEEMFAVLGTTAAGAVGRRIARSVQATEAGTPPPADHNHDEKYVAKGTKVTLP